MTDLDVTAAAGELWRARSEHELLDGLPADLRPRDLGDAYRIQDAFDAYAGRRVGWKLAATGAGGRAALGVDRPLAGPLYERYAITTGGSLAFGDIGMQTVEAEFGLMLASDLPADGAPYDRQSIVAALGAFVPAIEVPDTRYRDHRSAGGAQLTADTACGGYFVLGQRVTGYDPDALADHPVSLTTADGSASGTGAKVLGSPVEAVRWLANELARDGRGLRAGECVITGAAAAVRKPGSGPAVAHFGDLGTLTLILS
jgi:2-keto-4-pentenoate hydratase